MATLSTLKRIGRLCGWVALSGGAMIVAACGTMLSSGCRQPSPVGSARRDAGGAAGADASSGIVLPDGPSADAGTGEANATVDADKEDLWNVICE